MPQEGYKDRRTAKRLVGTGCRVFWEANSVNILSQVLNYSIIFSYWIYDTDAIK